METSADKTTAVVPAAFDPALARFQWRYRLGLFASGLLRTLFWAGSALLLFGIFDYFAGFNDAMRRMIAGVLAGVAGAGAILALWQSILFMRRQAAAEADRALGSQRREILSALELQPANGEPALTRWLQDRAIARAARNLDAMPKDRALPRRQLRASGARLLLLLLALGLCALAVPRASSIIARRLLLPAADVPPYSPLRFELSPRPVEVLYGGEIVITSDISGGEITSPVRVITRDPATGKIEESPAFHESAGKFSRKLEKMAAPLQIAFAVDRARSEWLPVKVLMQPKVREVVMIVQPPAYSGLPVREFAAGSQDLAALPGSRISARVASNRPLTGGTLRILGSAGDLEIQATADGMHTAIFQWTTHGAAQLTFQVKDVAGTDSEPVQIEQKLITDERPEVVLREPAGDVLATPQSELPLEASAEDDLGLTRVALVRRLQSYRERARPEQITTALRRHELTGKLDLSPYNLSPGQVIELTLEAADTNPNLLGVNVSEPSRVHIISPEQYAAVLRAQTTLEDFAGRYSALNDALENARTSLEKIEWALWSRDQKQIESARAKALEAHREAAKLLGEIAKDFPAFELDAGLSNAAADVQMRVHGNMKDLEQLEGASTSKFISSLPMLKQQIGQGQERLAQNIQMGERAVAAAKVFEQAGRFNEIVASQRGLVKELNRVVEQIRRGETRGGQSLRELARHQEQIAKDLASMDSALDEALDALPEEFAAMRSQGREFLALLRGNDPRSAMDEASRAAGENESRPAAEQAGEALRRLEQLLNQPNSFSAMCRGEEPGFPWPDDLAKTLQQLIQALVPRPGEGEGGGGGGGGGFSGISESGFFVHGKMVRMPVYGPPRMRFSRGGSPRIGDGRGSGRGAGESADVAGSEVGATAESEVDGGAVSLDNVPEAYREAVKRYFSIDQEPEGDLSDE